MTPPDAVQVGQLINQEEPAANLSLVCIEYIAGLTLQVW